MATQNSLTGLKTVVTMSSREIAELLEKQHNHIKVSADRLVDRGVIGTPALREFDHNGNTYTEYLQELFGDNPVTGSTSLLEPSHV